MMYVACWMLYVVCCSLLVVCSLLIVGGCLFGVCWSSLFVARSLLSVVGFVVCYV